MESDESNDTSSESGEEDDSNKPQNFSRSKRSSSRESAVSSKSSSQSRSSSSSSDAETERPSLERPPTPKSLTNGNCNVSPKSTSSKSSNKSKVSHDDSDEDSAGSDDSRNRRKSANLDDGNTSDSSETSVDASHGKAQAKTSDGQTDSVIEEDANSVPNVPSPKSVDVPGDINITHEDLSDVSDLEDSIEQSDSEEIQTLKGDTEIKDTYQNRDKKSDENDGEEQLDFEAEDGECADTDPPKDGTESKNEQEAGELEEEPDSKRKPKEDLEEGEISDEEESRPEETEPRPVCRFFSRGQCTWGASCRFLHPGVTDKGNYTMFDIVRPVIAGGEYINERPPYVGRVEPAPLESAWERGLRTAKEMMRKSIKRKEQDIDFEEKKMNLSIAQEELDKENGYYAKAQTSEPRYVAIRHAPLDDYPPMRIPPQEYYGRRPIIYDPPEYIPPPRERIRYREVPPQRSADYYSSKHEDEPSLSTSSSKSRKPKREVIVQRLEERSSRGDEWSDPWMRSKSPAGRKGAAPRKRSYSSGSSYSSSSSSHSSSATSRSSYRSRSRSRHKRSDPKPRRQVSPSVIVSERKAANERAALMNPPAPRKKALSPGMMRVGAQNPPAPVKVDQFGRTRSKLAVAAALARVKQRSKSSRSSSGSTSGSSSSDSESSGSSSSSSRNGSPSPRRATVGPSVDLAMALKAKAIDALKTGSEKRQIKLNLKNAVGQKKADLVEVVRKADASRKRLASSPPPGEQAKAISNKKASSRREELLKQLKAVEDAIAKKRSKV